MYDNENQKSEFDFAIFSSDFIILGLYMYVHKTSNLIETFK